MWEDKKIIQKGQLSEKPRPKAPPQELEVGLISEWYFICNIFWTDNTVKLIETKFS